MLVSNEPIYTVCHAMKLKAHKDDSVICKDTHE